MVRMWKTRAALQAWGAEARNGAAFTPQAAQQREPMKRSRHHGSIAFKGLKEETPGKGSWGWSQDMQTSSAIEPLCGKQMRAV
jgi:hypothetical protein